MVHLLVPVCLSNYIHVNRTGIQNGPNRFGPSEPYSLSSSSSLSVPFYTTFFGSFTFRDTLKCLTLLINVYISVCTSEHLCCKVSSWQLPSVSRVGLCDLHVKYWRLTQTPVCRSHNISHKNRLHPASSICYVWSDISCRIAGDCCCWINRTTGHVKSNGVKSQYPPVRVISGFHHGAHEIRAPLESYAAYPRFGTTYRFHLQRSWSSSWAWISVACPPVYAVLHFPVGCNNKGTATPLRPIHTRHAVPIPRTCRSPAMPGR